MDLSEACFLGKDLTVQWGDGLWGMDAVVNRGVIRMSHGFSKLLPLTSVLHILTVHDLLHTGVLRCSDDYNTLLPVTSSVAH